MKTIKINIKMVIFSSTLLLLPMSGLAGGGIDGDWVAHIQAYIEEDRIMVENGRNEKSLEAFNRRSEHAQQFRESNLPSIQEIEALLESPQIEEQIVASVAVMLAKQYSPTIVKRLTSNLGVKGPYDQSLFELKVYTKFALKKAPGDQLKQYEREIFEAIDGETNENTLFVMMTLYTDLSPQKSAVELTQLLIEHPSTIIKKTAYSLLDRLGEEHRQQAISALKQRGDQETLKLIETWDGPEQ